MSDKDLQRVLDRARYHKFVLPGGIETEGVDHSATAQAVFGSDLAGKSVLDIGCHHGYYCIEAVKRGAAGVTGVEGKNRAFNLAKRIRALYGYTQIEFVQGFYPKVRLEQKAFDVVLLMNVVHHLDSVRKARRMILRAAEMAAERLVLCIRPPEDDPPLDFEGGKLVESIEQTETLLNTKTGERFTEPRTLLSRRYIQDLLSPIVSRLDILDAPDYPKRFLAIGTK